MRLPGGDAACRETRQRTMEVNTHRSGDAGVVAYGPTLEAKAVKLISSPWSVPNIECHVEAADQSHDGLLPHRRRDKIIAENYLGIEGHLLVLLGPILRPLLAAGEENVRLYGC